MRLSPEQLEIITKTTSSVVGGSARVSLFGSRLDDSRSGGDVDLLVEATPAIGLLKRAKIKLLLEQKLNLPVDVTAAAMDDEDNPFVAIAKASSLCLNDLPMHPQL
jgi:predicted nucleotidyltransferase